MERDPMNTGWYPGKVKKDVMKKDQFHSAQKLIESMVPSGGYPAFASAYEADPGQRILGRGRLDEEIITCLRKSDAKVVAIKTVPSERSSFVELQRQFFVYGKLQEYLTAKDFVVPVLGVTVDREAEILHVATEVLDHGHIMARVGAEKPWSEERIWHVMKGLFTALAKVHALGLAHRQVRLDNLLAGSDGIDHPLLGGFTLACPAERRDDESPDDVFIKRHADGIYLAPELFKCFDNPSYLTSPKQDVFAAGVVLHVLLFGKSPYCAVDDDISTNWDRIMNSVCAKRDKVPTMFDRDMAGSLVTTTSPGSLDLLDRLLASKPEKRPDSAAVLKLPYFRDPLKRPPKKDRQVAHGSVRAFIERRTNVGRYS